MSDLYNPLVSIVIPVYNGSNYMQEAIDSALAQTYSNIEVIVVNDGSSDNTEQIAQSYRNKIRYFKKQNGGVASALNFAIKEMKGDYFSWLSHDDKYAPEKIESEIRLLQTVNDKSTIVYSGYIIIDDKSKIIREYKLDNEYSISDLNKPLFPYFNALLSGCTLLINREHFIKVGVFDETLKTTQDYDLWFRILRRANIIYDKNCLTYYRWHNEQTGAKDKTFKNQCTDLWMKCFNQVTEDEMVFNYGSVFSFYISNYLTFTKLGYNERVIPYLKEKIDNFAKSNDLSNIICDASHMYQLLNLFHEVNEKYEKSKYLLKSIRSNFLFRIFRKMRFIKDN